MPYPTEWSALLLWLVDVSALGKKYALIFTVSIIFLLDLI